jgi:hypothetical protein
MAKFKVIARATILEHEQGKIQVRAITTTIDPHGIKVA